MRFKESASNEVAMHQEVRRAYQLAAKHINGHDPKEINLRGFGEFYGYKAREMGLDRDTLILIGLRKKNTSGVSGATLKFGSPILDCNDGLAMYCMREFNEAELRSSVNSTGFLKVFQHEWLHLLDKTRVGDVLWNRPMDSHNQQQYFNDPAEFNAFYHDLAEPMLSIINAPASDAKDYMDVYSLTGNVQTDIASMMTADSITRRFVANLRPERRRSLLRRLYRLHQQMMAHARQ